MNDASVALREDLRSVRQTLIAQFQSRRNVERLLSGLSRAVDQVVRKAVQITGLERSVAIVAVGGYGRGALFPHSDVDILIIPARTPDEDIKLRIEQLVGLLWDLGLHLGHSVRTVAECRAQASSDVTILTSLLEARLVMGPRKLYRALSDMVLGCIDRQKFFQDKLLEQQQRHIRFNESPYSLEPNCKEGPGGLRDLQMLLWVARASGLGTRWHGLEARGLLTREETYAALRNEAVLKVIRAHLHILAGRREDRLLFDVQDAVAQALDIKPTQTRRASEILMQRYYWAAKAVTQLNTIVLQNIRERLFVPVDIPAVQLDDTFVAHNEVLDITTDDALERDRNGLLRAFLVLAQHDELQGMSVRLLRALWHGRSLINRDFRRDPQNRATFLALLQCERGVLHELRRMNQLSVLGHYLPVFRRIVGQMQYDLFHVYTVDQHILQVLRNLRRFSMAEHAHEYPLCSQIMTGLEKPWLLYIAALFHDIAKGRGGDHSELGARDARVFCHSHNLSRQDTALVVFLVRHHLTMSRVAQGQDIANPEVVDRFATVMGSQQRLDALYVFTVADIRGTSPKVWNAWKARLLEDLYQFARRRLASQSTPVKAELEQRKQRALDTLKLYGVSSQAHEPLWKQLDVVYFLRHTARDIAWHTRVLLAHVDTQSAVVRSRLSGVGEGAEVLVYVQDQQDLFARICAWFESRGMSIMDARIHTTRHGYALDTFLVTDERTHFEHSSELRTLVETELSEWIAMRAPLPEPNMGRLSRQSRNFPISPAVKLQPDAGGQRFLLGITGTDRVGLLYAIAHVLAAHEIKVLTAKINTLGERAEDIFLIEGELLKSSRGQLQLESDLLAVVSP